MPESVERARLIPILTTILKLSKEEVERVQSVVTGMPVFPRISLITSRAHSLYAPDVFRVTDSSILTALVHHVPLCFGRANLANNIKIISSKIQCDADVAT